MGEEEAGCGALVLPARKQAVFVCAAAAPAAACATGAGKLAQGSSGFVTPATGSSAGSSPTSSGSAGKTGAGLVHPTQHRAPSTGMAGSPWLWPQRTSLCQGAKGRLLPQQAEQPRDSQFPRAVPRTSPTSPSGVHGTAPLPLAPQAGAGMKQAAARAAQPRRWYVAAPVLGCR